MAKHTHLAYPCEIKERANYEIAVTITQRYACDACWQCSFYTQLSTYCTVGEESDMDACNLKVLTDNAENLNSAISVALHDACSASIRVPDATEREVSVAKNKFDLGMAIWYLTKQG